MKKNTEEKVEENGGERPTSNVRQYFTKDVLSQIGDMSVKDMELTLKGMINSREWIAMLKYNSMRTPILDSMLMTESPTKNPDKISWAQGCKAGICDLENYVIDLNAPVRAPANKEESGDEGTLLDLS